MLYKNKERITDLSEYLPQLKSVFPSFFSETNPKGIQIRYVEASKHRVKKRVGNSSKGGTISMLESPRPMSVKAISYVTNEKGLREEVVYSELAPIYNPKVQMTVFPRGATTIELGDTTYLRPKQDLEKLVYLYFYSGMLTNSKNPNGQASLEFVVPEIVAASRVLDTNARRVNQLESEILFGGVSIDVVKNVLSVLGIPTDEDDNVLRTRLFDYLMPAKNKFNDGALAQYESLKNSGGNDEAEVTELVNFALREGFIVDTENGWCFVGKNGTTGTPFAEISGIETREKVDNLIKAIVADTKLKGRLDKALSKS